MNLQEITQSLETKYREWGVAHIEEIDETAAQFAIRQRVVAFIQQAIDSPQTKTGNPLTATRNALRLSAFANFRFGLLVGILLHAPEAPATVLVQTHDVTAPCPDCLGTGLVCMSCGFVRFDCSCVGDDGAEGYSPVECDTCMGKGELD